MHLLDNKVFKGHDDVYVKVLWLIKILSPIERY